MTTIIGHRKGMASGPHLYSAAGDILIGAGAGQTVKLAAGTQGQLLGADGTTISYIGPPSRVRPLPTGAIAESFPRFLVPSNQAAALTSGTLLLIAVGLGKGQLVSSASFWSGTTALATGTHQYFSLHDSGLVRRALSADDTSTAWAASTKKTLSFTTPYTVTASGLYYVGILVAATTVPTLFGNSETSNVVTTDPPFSCGTADTGVTAIPSTAAALTYQSKVPYCFVS